MEERAFNDEVDGIFEAIEYAIDDLTQDVDVDSGGGILTIAFPDRSSVVLSRQLANREIWIAAKSGGFHLHKKADEWHCATTGESLSVLVDRVFMEQLGETLSPDWLH